jgi:hypothetical protein
MHKHFASTIVLILGSSFLAACSSDGSLLGTSLTTASITPAPAAKAQATAAKLDPLCISLVARIDALRKDGITGRVEKASVGKTKTVAVKRASLAQIAELDKANAEFQARCSAPGLRPPMQAQLSPAASQGSNVVPPIVTQSNQAR